MKYLATALAFLVLAGCGCGDENPEIPPNPTFRPTSFEMRTEFPPIGIPVRPEDPDPEPLKIDVFFLLDDSFWFNNRTMGIIPNNALDARTRTAVAQGIMKNLRENLKADLATRYPGRTFDIAFGVGRYEDYPGWQSQSGGTVDTRSLPFILNMPVLREDYDQNGVTFANLFDAAIAREALGDGQEVLNGVRQTGPTSAYEALYQIGSGKGYDGNNDGDTLDTGLPCSNEAQGLATPPAVSGDVPAVQYARRPTDDNNGRPVYFVQGENGLQGDDSCIASGNLGGAGWRPDAARFLIMATDIAPVAVFTDTPLRDDPQAAPPTVDGQPNGTRDNPPVFVRSSNGAPDAPRNGENVNTGGTQATFRVNDAPLNAAGVQDAINAINSLDIEILSLGAPTILPDDRKPNTQLPTDNPQDPNQVNAVLTPSTPALTPWTFLSALSILTGTRLPETAGGSEDFPAVYNLGTVWPADINTGNPLAINTDVRSDLVLRISKWVDGGFITENPGGGGGQFNFPLPALPQVFMDFTLEMPNLADLPGVNIIEFATIPFPANNRQTQTAVQIPVFYYRTDTNQQIDVDGNLVNGGAFPDPLSVTYDFDWQYIAPEALIDQAPITDVLPYQAYIQFNSIAGQTAANQTIVDDLVARLQTPQVARTIPTSPGAAATKNVTMLVLHSGNIEVSIHNSASAPSTPAGATLLSPGNWCLGLEDKTWPSGSRLDPMQGTCTDTFPVPNP